MIKAGGKNVLFTQFMRSIRSRGPDAEGFSRQLDLKEISCLGGHLRDPEGQAKYVAHVLILSVPPLVPAITNQHPFPLRPERALQSFKHGVPSSHYQRCGAGMQDETTCYSSSGGDGGIRSHWAILDGEPQEVVASTSAGVDTMSCCPLEVCLP